VDRVTQLGDCSASDLRALAVGYPLHEAEDYWRNLASKGTLGRLSAVVIWTRDERRREPPFKRLAGLQAKDPEQLLASSWFASSWIVLDRSELDTWLEPGSTNRLAEVDAPPDVPGDDAAWEAYLEKRRLSFVWQCLGCLILGLIGLAVLAFVLLNWVL
jgi:hypothetical protein